MIKTFVSDHSKRANFFHMFKKTLKHWSFFKKCFFRNAPRTLSDVLKIMGRYLAVSYRKKLSEFLKKRILKTSASNVRFNFEVARLVTQLVVPNISKLIVNLENRENNRNNSI